MLPLPRCGFVTAPLRLCSLAAFRSSAAFSGKNATPGPYGLAKHRLPMLSRGVSSAASSGRHATPAPYGLAQHRLLLLSRGVSSAAFSGLNATPVSLGSVVVTAPIRLCFLAAFRSSAASSGRHATPGPYGLAQHLLPLLSRGVKLRGILRFECYPCLVHGLVTAPASSPGSRGNSKVRGIAQVWMLPLSLSREMLPLLSRGISSAAFSGLNATPVRYGLGTEPLRLSLSRGFSKLRGIAQVGMLPLSVTVSDRTGYLCFLAA